MGYWHQSLGYWATGVADKPKALPYWLRVDLRKLVEKGAPGLHKALFFKPISEAVSLGAKCG